MRPIDHGVFSSEGGIMDRSILFVMARLTHSGVETMLRAVGPEARQMRVLADAERTRHLYSWRQGGDRMFHLYGRQP